MRGLENKAEVGWEKRLCQSGWGSCSSKVEVGTGGEDPFSLIPRERWVLLKPSMRASFLLFPAAPRPGTDSTINSRKGNWKECPRKRVCGRQAGRQWDWTPPGHSPSLSFLLNPNSLLQAITSTGEMKGQRTETKPDLM